MKTFGIALSFIFLITGCVTAPEHTTPRKTGPQNRPISAPPAPAVPPPQPIEIPSAPLPNPATPPANPAVAPAPGLPVSSAAPVPGRRVALILGPGGTRSFAYIGVLREFERRHIPVEAVIGLEWGSLPAALYAQDGKANDVEWQMLKIRPELLPRSGILTSAMEPASTDGLNEYLKTAFGEKQTGNSRVHFMCPYTAHDGERVAWANNGKLRDLVAMCLPYSPLFETHGNRAAPFSSADAAYALRHQGYTDIVMVNVLGNGPILAPQKFSDGRVNEILWSEIRLSVRTTSQQSNWPIDIALHGAGLTGIEKARDLMTQGQKAAAPTVERIATSLGLINAN